MIFDKRCIFCSKYGQYICDKCLLDMKKYKYSNKENSNIVCGYYYKKEIRDAILRFKFKNKRYHAKAFAKMMLEDFDSFDFDKIDIITPVPSSKKRLRKRGYNQCELILKEICKLRKVKMHKNILKRKDSVAQSSIKLDERVENIKDKFYSNQDLSGKNILVIEDVYTTGSTVRAITKVLREQNANKIYICVLAKSENIVENNNVL